MAVSLSGCSKLPEFPQFDPVSIIPTKNKAFNCRIVDKENMQFECDDKPHAIDGALDGFFCVSPQQTKDIINWAQDVKRRAEKKCN